MNSLRVLRSHRYLYLILLLVFVSALMIVSLSYSQPGNKATKKIAFYKITGRLQVFSLEDKRAQIDDLIWDLADDFRTKEIPRAWKKGTIEFTERKVWVYYYVSLVTVKGGSLGSKQTDKKAIQLITDPDEIQKIHERGGKIYKIERLPA